VVTYVVSVSVAETRAASIVLTVQLATVWLTLRTSQAHRLVRLIADIVLCLAAVVAGLSFFVHNPGDQLGGIFTVGCPLYLIAPFSIVRHLIMRQQIDTETLLGAIAAYLLIGMFFAFAYKAAGEFGRFSGLQLAREDPAHLQAADSFGDRALRRFSRHRQMLLPGLAGQFCALPPHASAAPGQPDLTCRVRR